MTSAAERERIAEALRSGPRITPSQRDSWHGTPAPGSRWTAQQLRTIVAEGRDPDTIATTMVPVKVESRWGGPPDTVQILCPMLARTRTKKRALIISPAGDKLWKDLA